MKIDDSLVSKFFNRETRNVRQVAATENGTQRVAQNKDYKSYNSDGSLAVFGPDSQGNTVRYGAYTIGQNGRDYIPYTAVNLRYKGPAGVVMGSNGRAYDTLVAAWNPITAAGKQVYFDENAWKATDKILPETA